MNAARKPLIAGNWKMHHGGLSGLGLAAACAKLAPRVPHVDVVIAPPYTAIAAIAAEVDGSGVGVAAQNLHEKTHGAFTGEISAAMLKESGAAWVIIGHSERRQLYGETDAAVTAKVRAALDAGLVPIVCVGETLAEREANHTLDVVGEQVDAFVGVLAGTGVAAAIAYEPVWAIGTGRNAGPSEAEEVHAAIREWLRRKSERLAGHTRILYGGSVKPDNARSLLRAPNVDGALIGGASLDVASFSAIAEAAEELTH